VVEQLLESGAQVRATSRNPATAGLPAGVDVRAADLVRPATLPAVLSGVDKVFLFPEPDGIDGFVEAAQAAGVRHVVLLSSQAVHGPEDESDFIRNRHVVVEDALRASGIDWTFVRPGAFATNSLMWARSVKADREVRWFYPDVQVAPVHEQDIAAVVVAALLNDGHENVAYDVTGPESLSQRRLVELIGEAIGVQLNFVALGHDEALAEVGQFMPVPIVASMLDYNEKAGPGPAPISDGVQQATGKPGRTFAQWAIDHAADFK
jgi:uncharacterized protein YbjT (DUF2867 family)